MIRVVLPYHLKNMTGVGGEVELEVEVKVDMLVDICINSRMVFFFLH